MKMVNTTRSSVLSRPRKPPYLKITKSTQEAPRTTKAKSAGDRGIMIPTTQWSAYHQQARIRLCNRLHQNLPFRLKATRLTSNILGLLALHHWMNMALDENNRSYTTLREITILHSRRTQQNMRAGSMVLVPHHNTVIRSPPRARPPRETMHIGRMQTQMLRGIANKSMPIMRQVSCAVVDAAEHSCERPCWLARCRRSLRVNRRELWLLDCLDNAFVHTMALAVFFVGI